MTKNKIKILLTDQHKPVPFSALRLRRMLWALCERFGIERGVISIAIVDDDGIRQVNRRFLKSLKRTDVISFDLSDDESEGRIFDIVVNGQRCAVREAQARGHSSAAELVLYIIHGFLHNVGYDDLSPGKFKKMHKAEDEIMNEFGYGQTYAAQSGGNSRRKKNT